MNALENSEENSQSKDVASDHGHGSLVSDSASDSAEEFFVKFKETIPINLKNQLALCGFTNSISIAHSDHNWIKQIESYIHSALGERGETNKEVIAEICGPYCTDPKKYVVPPGHAAMLNHLKSVICEKIGRKSSPGLSSVNKNTRQDLRSSRGSLKSEIKSKVPSEVSPEDPEVSPPSSIPSRYQKDLENIVSSYFKKIGFEGTSPEIQIYNNVNTKGLKTLAAKINCLFCNKTVNIFYDTSRATGRWIISNYMHHVDTTHLKKQKTDACDNNDKTSDETSSNKNKKNLQNKIIHYFPTKSSRNQKVVDKSSKQPSQNFSYTSVSGSSSRDDSLLDNTEEEEEEEGLEEGTSFGSEQQQREILSPNQSKPESSEPKKYSNKYQKFSRTYRNKQKLLKVGEDKNQQKITDFFDNVLPNLVTLISETDTFKEAFSTFSPSSKEFNKKSHDSLPPPQTDCNEDRQISFLLKKLSAMSQKVKKTNTDRFDDFLKQFSTYLFLIGGRMTYEIIQANLPLPSLSTVSRYLKQSRTRIVEGALRITELHEYLKERDYGTVVWLSEDGTRILDKVQYDNVTNTLVGLTLPLENGLPVINYFKATDARTIENYVTNYPTSSIAYTVLVQPLEVKAPPFCLCIFGTNNKFRALDVMKRWQVIKDAAAEKGITVLGVSGDGDSRILRAMEINSKIGQTVSHQIGDFFAMPLTNKSNMYYIQDTIHVGGKLRNKLLNEKSCLKIGNFEVSKAHLVRLTEVVNKDLHFIRDNDLDGSDKMNFDGVERISSENVQLLLQQHVPNSQGTQLFLKCLRCVLDSFLKPNLEPLERLRKIWFAVFVFRIWRAWILDTKNCSLSKNFITRNSYICMELNAHALTLLLYNQDTLEPRNFLPHLLSSQPCEQFFRTLRSMTTTQSTIVNFSMLDILYRIGRVSLQEALSQHLIEEGIKLPRFQKNLVHVTPEMPSQQEIIETIVSAEHDALVVAFEFNLDLSSDTTFQCTVTSSEDLEEEEDIDEDTISFEVEDNNENSEEMPGGYLEDMRKLEMVDDINLKNFGHLKEDESLDEDSAFVAVKIKDKKPVVIRKSSLVWLLRKDSKRISTDRVFRFRH